MAKAFSTFKPLQYCNSHSFILTICSCPVRGICSWKCFWIVWINSKTVAPDLGSRLAEANGWLSGSKRALPGERFVRFASGRIRNGDNTVLNHPLWQIEEYTEDCDLDWNVTEREACKDVCVVCKQQLDRMRGRLGKYVFEFMQPTHTWEILFRKNNT